MKPILLVEDDANDAFCIKRAISLAGIQNSLIEISDGDDALAWLEILRSDLLTLPDKMPALVLLDLKLPGKSGYELLRWIRSKSILHSLPVVTLITSVVTPEARITSQLGANGCLLKPPNKESLQDLNKRLQLIDLVFAEPAHNHRHG